MKIAYYAGTFNKEDGVSRVILALIREARKNGIESLVITGRSNNKPMSSVPIIQVPAFTIPLYKQYRIPWPIMKSFEKELDEFKPDIIHINSPDIGALAVLKYARTRKIPIVATHHTDFGRYLSYYHLAAFNPTVKIILKRLYKKMSFITTPAIFISDELQSYGVPEVYTIPWGVEFSVFNNSFRSLEWRNQVQGEENKIIILCVCRLTWEKDLCTLAETYNLLKQHRNDFTMLIVGDGPVRQKIESMMPGAIFLGYLEGEELSTAYASSDIFLFPSSTETFGNVNIEAIASGLVPVVADAGGSKSIISEGINGLLAQPKNSQEFYEKVCLLMDDEELRKNIQSRGVDFIKDFSWEKSFDGIWQLYTKLLVK
jgi:glycosyltransferase involved in cell wall biosynthesis